AEAANISLEHMQDFDGATSIFAALFDEDVSDEVAVHVVDTFAELLEARGKDAEVVALWEQQASWREAAEQRNVAAELWARAAEIAEPRLADEAKAVADYERGAALGGLVSLEALARIRTQRSEHALAAEVLEQICRIAPAELVQSRVLGLAEAYLAAGD